MKAYHFELKSHSQVQRDKIKVVLTLLRELTWTDINSTIQNNNCYFGDMISSMFEQMTNYRTTHTGSQYAVFMVQMKIATY